MVSANIQGQVGFKLEMEQRWRIRTETKGTREEPNKMARREVKERMREDDEFIGSWRLIPQAPID